MGRIGGRHEELTDPSVTYSVPRRNSTNREKKVEKGNGGSTKRKIRSRGGSCQARRSPALHGEDDGEKVVVTRQHSLVSCFFLSLDICRASQCTMVYDGIRQQQQNQSLSEHTLHPSSFSPIKQ